MVPKLQKKRVSDTKALPGWGAEGGDWADMDRLNEEELQAAEAALLAGAGSHIAQSIQQLSLGGGPEGSDGAGEQAAGSGSSPGDLQAEQQRRLAVAGSGGSQGSDDEDDDEDGEEGDGGWQTAARTLNVARRERRRAIRRAAHEAEAAEQQQQQQQQQEEKEEKDEEDAWESQGEEGSNAGSASGSEGGEEDQGEEEEEAAAGAGSSGVAGGQGAAFESTVSIITADFAMQNVALQMGLRLVTPDGRRINRLSKWVLRCAACFQVTKVRLPPILFCCCDCMLLRLPCPHPPTPILRRGLRRMGEMRLDRRCSCDAARTCRARRCLAKTWPVLPLQTVLDVGLA